MKDEDITYERMERIQDAWENHLKVKFSKCTCLDCLDRVGMIRCKHIFDFYNFDGDCLNLK